MLFFRQRIAQITRRLNIRGIRVIRWRLSLGERPAYQRQKEHGCTQEREQQHTYCRDSQGCQRISDDFFHSL